MKLLHKFMAATLAVSLLAGCSSEPKKEGPPSDKDFILNVSKGLEARWELADNEDTDSYSSAELQKAYTKFLKAETDAVGKESKYKFKDKDLKKVADTYYKGLKLQEEGIQYAGTDDYTNQAKTWELGYNYRALAIHGFEKDYGLTVSSKYKSDLDNFLSQYSVAKKEVAIQEFVDNLQESIQYTKDESQSDEYTTYYSTIIENTTEYTIDSLSIQLDFLDGSGVILYQGDDYVSNLAAGSKIQSTVYYDAEKGEPSTLKPIITVYYN